MFALASSDLVLQVFSLPYLFTYIFDSVNIFFAVAKGFSHRCCYGQYLSIFYPYYLATILPAYNLRRSAAFFNIMQRHSLPQACLIWTQWLYVQCLCGLPDCTGCIGYSKLPCCFAFPVYSGNLHKEVLKESLVVYQGNSICCFCWGQVIGMLVLWIRLKPMHFILVYSSANRLYIHTIVKLFGWVGYKYPIAWHEQ